MGRAKYRTMTDGEDFRIQQRVFWLFWIWVENIGGSYAEFDTRKEAAHAIRRLEDGWMLGNAWRPVANQAAGKEATS